MENIKIISQNLNLIYYIFGILGLLAIILILILKSNNKLKLLPELIPYSMHYKNVRAVLTDTEWRTLAKVIYKNSNFRCDICNRKGRIECHEIWSFNDKKLIQKLTGLTSLCHECHQVKHIGLARKMGFFGNALEHMSKVNGITEGKAKKYIEYAEMSVKNRKEEYNLDLTYLNNFRNILPRKYTGRENENCNNIKGNW